MPEDLTLTPPSEETKNTGPQWNPNEDIEPQLNRIEDELKEKVMAIPAKDPLSKRAEFNKIVDEAIDKCFQITKEMEEAGFYDANTSNKIHSRIQSFRDMKNNGSLSLIPRQQSVTREEQIIQEQEQKKNREPNGITEKLKKGTQIVKGWFGRKKSVQQNAEENVR